MTRWNKNHPVTRSPKNVRTTQLTSTSDAWTNTITFGRTVQTNLTQITTMELSIPRSENRISAPVRPHPARTMIQVVNPTMNQRGPTRRRDNATGSAGKVIASTVLIPTLALEVPSKFLQGTWLTWEHAFLRIEESYHLQPTHGRQDFFHELHKSWGRMS